MLASPCIIWSLAFCVIMNNLSVFWGHACLLITFRLAMPLVWQPRYCVLLTHKVQNIKLNNYLLVLKLSLFTLICAYKVNIQFFLKDYFPILFPVLHSWLPLSAHVHMVYAHACMVCAIRAFRNSGNRNWEWKTEMVKSSSSCMFRVKPLLSDHLIINKDCLVMKTSFN